MDQPRSDRTGVPVANPLDLTLDELRTRTSAKWRVHGEDVIPMWVAEMDVLLAEPVARAVHDAIRRGDTGYPAGTGYAEAFSRFAAERWGWTDLAVERTAVVPDVMLGVVELLRLVTEPGAAVVVNTPVYPPFFPFVEYADRRVVEAPLGEDHRLGLEALAEAFTAAGPGAAYLLCSPHNPTGTVHTAEELTRVASLADAFGVRVVVDEIHAPIVLAGAEFTPYLTVPGGSWALSLLSASKGWNLAGLKAALAVAGTDAADDLARLPEVVGHGPSHLGLIAHTAAIADGGAWLDALLVGLDANRALLARLLDEHLPEVGFSPPQATYLAWLDCRDLQPGPTELTNGTGRVEMTDPVGRAATFLDAGVALSAGEAFGGGGAGHVRLTYATSPAILTEAVRRMGTARSAG